MLIVPPLAGISLTTNVNSGVPYSIVASSLSVLLTELLLLPSHQSIIEIVFLVLYDLSSLYCHSSYSTNSFKGYLKFSQLINSFIGLSSVKYSVYLQLVCKSLKLYTNGFDSSLISVYWKK